MGLSTLRTLRALGVIVPLFALLLFSSCEETDQNSSADQPVEPEGIVQAKVEDGQSYVALALAPKEPGGEAPDLSAWKGRDLFAVGQRSASDPDPRARGIITAPTINQNVGYIYTSVGSWRLRDRYLQVLTGSLNGGFANDAGGRVSTSYLSDDCVYWTRTYDLSGEKRQKLSVEHDKLKGVAEIYWRNGIIYAEVNGGPPLFAGRISESYLTNVNLTLILPLEGGLVENGMPNDLLAEYVGVWTVKAEPDVAPFPGSAEGGTPFTFSLRSLIVEEIEAVKRDDLINPQTQAKESAGATFTAVAKMNKDTALDPNLDGAYYRENGRTLYWRADVFPERNPRDQIRRFTGSAPFVATGTRIEIDWDGLSNAGTRQPGETNHGISVTAVIGTSGQDPNNALGEIVTVTPGAGPSEIIHDDVKLELSPNPYIPYTSEELAYSFDADGNPVWPDDDGDGQPDRFPDHNHDGVPDLQPGESPPPLKISAKVFKLGYKTSWYLEVLDEKGDQVESDPSSPSYPPGPPWSGNNDVDLEWRYPRADLDPQKLKFVLTVTRCRNEPNVQILGQTTTPTVGCPSVKFDGEIAYGDQPLTLEIRAGSNVVGSSNDKLQKPSADAIKRLSKVNPDATYHLVASNVKYVDDAVKPQRIKVVLTGPGSGKTGDINLNKVTVGEEVTYEADISLSSLNQGTEPLSSFTFVDSYLEGKTSSETGQTTDNYYNHNPDTSNAMMGALSNVVAILTSTSGVAEIMPYGAPIRRGFHTLLRPHRDYEDTNDNSDAPFEMMKDEAYASEDNLKVPGFVTLTATIRAEDNRLLLLTENSEATVKIGKPADMLATYTHGGPSGAIFLDPSGNGKTLGPSDFEANVGAIDISHIKTWLIAGCHVLDMYDFNNNKTQRGGGRTGPDDPLEKRLTNNTGGGWWRATGRGRVVLIGYNYIGQGAGTRDAIANYAASMDDMKAKGVPDDRCQQYAWLDANLKAWDGATAYNLNACAWDKANYYFISYWPPVDYALKPGNPPVFRTVYGVYSVPHDGEGENLSVGPASTQNGPPSGAELISEIKVPKRTVQP